jgi:hypothetical protein
VLLARVEPSIRAQKLAGERTGRRRLSHGNGIHMHGWSFSMGKPLVWEFWGYFRNTLAKSTIYKCWVFHCLVRVPDRRIPWCILFDASRAETTPCPRGHCSWRWAWRREWMGKDGNGSIVGKISYLSLWSLTRCNNNESLELKILILGLASRSRLGWVAGDCHPYSRNS